MVDDLAKAILQIFSKDMFGLFNTVGSTCLSRYQFALKLAEKFNLDKDLIIPASSVEKKQIADLVLHLLLSKQSFENEKKEAPVNKHKHWKESSRNAIFSQTKISRSKW